jgi:hypothetical protein
VLSIYLGGRQGHGITHAKGKFRKSKTGINNSASRTFSPRHPNELGIRLRSRSRLSDSRGLSAPEQMNRVRKRSRKLKHIEFIPGLESMTMINMKNICPLRLQSEKLLIEELPKELMIFDPDRNKAFCLNHAASFVWKQADGKTPVAEMAKRLERDLGRPVDEQVIWFALEVLSKDGLLRSAMIPPPSAARVTRRDLLQKMGVGAMALPVVTVLFVSPAKAHASSMAPTAPSNVPISAAHQASGGFWKWLENLF